MPHPSRSAPPGASQAQLTPRVGAADPAHRRASSGARLIDASDLLLTPAVVAEHRTWLARESARFEAIAREIEGRTPPSESFEGESASVVVGRHTPELTSVAPARECGR